MNKNTYPNSGTFIFWVSWKRDSKKHQFPFSSARALCCLHKCLASLDVFTRHSFKRPHLHYCRFLSIPRRLIGLTELSPGNPLSSFVFVPYSDTCLKIIQLREATELFNVKNSDFWKQHAEAAVERTALVARYWERTKKQISRNFTIRIIQRLQLDRLAKLCFKKLLRGH